ncbi:hypothetical protein M406DRAFT_65980 [Cryphonectria parasitica EP155]|uniref:Uncharacterized protein n=1 Tax=Cryphonectria parasitica (strain ATCC 38755 / EP155) TaxID=660469 RepID=A0A9P5CSN8_CRYP1|nr:uncharacterized protein M406DRAFT_65980 [Cryphonectria parasitica EP155]KAF3769488.1 hypothetical protein M406DRAFT_65980 [Cryphonectria parasitica EP155]
MPNSVLRNSGFSRYDFETSRPNQVRSFSRRVHFEDDESRHNEEGGDFYYSSTTWFAREQDSPSRHNDKSDDITNKMSTSPPSFEVPEPWRKTMAMISINAGFTPHLILHEYYKWQPIQAATQTCFTMLNFDHDVMAIERGIRYIHICYRDNDPSKIYQIVLTLRERDPVTKHDALNLVTHTSIRHVLEEPCANCPLWLLARPDEHDPSDDRFHILPCCDTWFDSMDFEKPLSDTEKRFPGVVDRLINELHRQTSLLAEKEEELAMLKGANMGGENGLARVRQPGQLGAESLLQCWWLGAVLLGFLIVVILK